MELFEDMSVVSMTSKKIERAVNEQWFKEIFRQRGITQRQFAKNLHVHYTLISHIFGGRRKPTIQDAALWSISLDVSFEDVIRNFGINLPKEFSHMADREKGVQKCLVQGFIDSKLSVTWTPQGLTSVLNPTGRSDVGALRCRTLGSPFKGIDGALFYYPLRLQPFSSDSLGRIALVEIEGTPQPLIRIVERGYEAGRHNLTLLNSELSEEGVDVKTATPILQMKL